MTDTNVPVVAVVDPVASAGPYGAQAARIGVDTIAVLSQEFSTPYVLASYRTDDYRAVLRLADFDNLDKLAGALEAYHVRAVIPGAQTGVGPSDLLAARMRLLGNNVDLVEARTNKDKMKAAWRRSGLACADWHTVRSVTEAVELADRLSYPVVAKPPASAGSSHVTRCDDKESVLRAVHRILTAPDMYGNTTSYALIESFIDGPEYSANIAYSPHIESPQIVCAASFEKVRLGDNLSVYRNFRSVSPDLPAIRNSISYLQAVNAALGVRIGINDTEFKYSAGGPVAIEVNNRLPGALIPEMIEACTGTSPFSENVRLYLGADSVATFQFEKNFLVCCLINIEPGSVVEIDGLDLVRKLPSYDRSRILARRGAYVPATTGLASAWGLVCLVHEDLDQLEEDAEIVHEKLTLRLK
ncbi:ATP-grasp domain-containing protein [Nocardia sp. NPDC050175]|uniref:ATP-grasp domain-containing protein n=1 Tax=Nocardia sp. NPDC050175 TaxID=3364317 RepID=UPI0037AC8B96